jgi:hypothetical protein
MWEAHHLVGLLTIAFLGCAQSDVSKPHVSDAIHSAVILVPGYYGTRLVRESDGKLVWISAGEAIAGDLPLTLPIPGLGLHDAIQLKPAGILEKVPIIPLLYAVDGYGSMLEALREYGKGRATIVPFSYDWRDDLMASARKLDTVIRDLHMAGAADIRIAWADSWRRIIFDMERKSPSRRWKPGSAPRSSVEWRWSACRSRAR